MLDTIDMWVSSTFDNQAAVLAVRVGVAIAILVIGGLVARLVASVAAGAINRFGFAKSANEAAGPGKKTVGGSIGQALFWVLMLGVFAAALAAMGMQSLVAPVEDMYTTFAGYIPQLFGAALIFIFGGIFATIAQRAVFHVASASPLDEWVGKAGFSKSPDDEGLSKGVSWVVYALIIIPVAIAGLERVGIPAISDPATEMLNQVVAALPKVLLAAILLAIAYAISRFVSTLINAVLPNFGLDDAAKKYGILTDSDVTLTNVVSTIATVAIMLFGAVEATKALGFDMLSDFVTIIIEQGGSILFGTVIIIGGVIFSGIVANLIDGVGDGISDQAAKLVKAIIMGLAILMGISRMGLDPTGGEFILQAALILLIGAAIAGGIAFGLGGKEWAAKQLDKLK